MRLRLESAANVALIVTCLAAPVLLANRYLTERKAPDVAPPYPERARMTALQGVNYGDTPYTVLLFVRSTCRYCTESMPLYKKLGEAAGSRKYRVVVASHEDPVTAQNYFANHGAQADRILKVSFPPLRITGTPTLIVVDSKGMVRRSWLGKVPVSAEAGLLALLGSAKS